MIFLAIVLINVINSSIKTLQLSQSHEDLEELICINCLEYARGISNYYSIFLNTHHFFWLFFLTSFWTIKIILHCNICCLFSVMFYSRKYILKITKTRKDLTSVHSVPFIEMNGM